MLGLHFDHGTGQVILNNPVVPQSAGDITIRNLSLRDARADFVIRQNGSAISLEVLRTTGDIKVSLMFGAQGRGRAA
jgi:hypothetical protein